MKVFIKYLFTPDSPVAMLAERGTEDLEMADKVCMYEEMMMNN